jgi:hypothetical protein
MLKVRSGVGAIAVTTSVAVFVGLPVVAFAQVPSVNQVVGGAQDTVGGVVQTPSLPTPSLPAPSLPAPSLPSPSAPSAPAPVPNVQAPAPAPVPKAPSVSVPNPPSVSVPNAPSVSPQSSPQQGGSGPAAQAPGGSASTPAQGQAQARSADTPARSSGGGKSSGRRGAKGGSGKGRGDRAKANASGDKAGASQNPIPDGTELAIASRQADDLPDDASPAKLPFSGFQLALMGLAGLVALAGGMAVRHGALRLHFRRAAP